MINEVVKSGLQPVNELRGGEIQPRVTTGPATETAQPAQAQDVSPAKLQNAVTKLNEHVQNLQRTLSFSVSKETGRTIIKVYDEASKELIRQIPPEDAVKLAESIDKQSSSLLLQDQA